MNEDTGLTPWPAGDVTPERFNLTINEDRSVTLFDGETPIERFTGPEALAEALQRRMQLTGLAEAGLEEMTPAKFVTETLPKFARRQRLEGMLAEVRTAESAALAELTDVIALLNRAISLRERLEKSLETATRPLSAEQPSVKGLACTTGHAYHGDGVHGCDALLAGKVRCGAGRAYHPEWVGMQADADDGPICTPEHRLAHGHTVACGPMSTEQTSAKGRVTQTATARTTHHGEGRVTIDFNSAGIQPYWSRNWSHSWSESETVSRIGTYKPQPY